MCSRPVQWTAPKGETAQAGLRKALMKMGSTVLAFGGIALVYSGTEVLLESMRGTADWRNGAIAGLASGTSPTILIVLLWSIP